MIMDINIKINELLSENEAHQKTIEHLKSKVKANNRTVGKLRTALTHVGNIIGDGALHKVPSGDFEFEVGPSDNTVTPV